MCNSVTEKMRHIFHKTALWLPKVHVWQPEKHKLNMKKHENLYFFSIKENMLNYNRVYGKQGQRSIAPTTGWFLISSLRSCFSFHPGIVNPVPPQIPLGTYHTRQGKRLEPVKENPELWITPLSSSSSFSVGSEHPPNAYIQKPSQRYDLSKVEKKLLKCV